MSPRNQVEEKVLSLIEPVIAPEGYELVDVEYVQDRGKWVLRLYIDLLPGDEVGDRGVTVADTTAVTHLIDPILDVEDVIAQAYSLEVSSPGLNRPLRTEAHFQRFVGADVKLRTRAPVEGAEGRRNFRGEIRGCEAGVVKIEVDGTLFEVPHASIERANVQYRFDN